MSRVLHLSVVFLALAGQALAQVPPPAAANAPGAPGPGRGGFPPIVIGPPAPAPPVTRPDSAKPDGADSYDPGSDKTDVDTPSAGATSLAGIPPGH